MVLTLQRLSAITEKTIAVTDSPTTYSLPFPKICVCLSPKVSNFTTSLFQFMASGQNGQSGQIARPTACLGEQEAETGPVQANLSMEEEIALATSQKSKSATNILVQVRLEEKGKKEWRISNFENFIRNCSNIVLWPLLFLVNGAWETWGPWGQCSTTCGSFSTQERTRQCGDPPPAFEGLDCEGNRTESLKCPRSPCRGN